MVKKINGQDWFCCPACGKKLFILYDGAVCRGVQTKCRGKLPNGEKCTWEGEVKIF